MEEEVLKVVFIDTEWRSIIFKNKIYIDGTIGRY